MPCSSAVDVLLDNASVSVLVIELSFSVPLCLVLFVEFYVHSNCELQLLNDLVITRANSDLTELFYKQYLVFLLQKTEDDEKYQLGFNFDRGKKNCTFIEQESGHTSVRLTVQGTTSPPEQGVNIWCISRCRRQGSQTTQIVWKSRGNHLIICPRICYEYVTDLL